MFSAFAVLFCSSTIVYHIFIQYNCICLYIQDNPALLDTLQGFIAKYDATQPVACQAELTRVIKDTTNTYYTTLLCASMRCCIR